MKDCLAFTAREKWPNPKRSVSSGRLHVLLVTVLMLFTAERLPAPILELSPTPAPERSANASHSKPKAKTESDSTKTRSGSESTLNAVPVALLDGKLKLELTDAFAADNSHTSKQSIGDYKARNSDGWGSILRGTHGLQPDGLDDYAKKKVADYTKGLSWLPRLDWLKNEIVTINGRKWADLRFIAPRKDAKDPRDGLMYTRIFATSHGGQLLEIMFTSNTDPNPALKDKIDKVIESVRLED